MGFRGTVLAKKWRRIIPVVGIAHLWAFIDGESLSDADLGLAAGIFFIGYFILEIPGTYIVERFSARKWIARIMISWGLITALTGLVKDRV